MSRTSVHGTVENVGRKGRALFSDTLSAPTYNISNPYFHVINPVINTQRKVKVSLQCVQKTRIYFHYIILIIFTWQGL